MYLALSGQNNRMGSKMLENRYANKHNVLHSHLQGMFNLPKVQNNFAEKLRNLLIAFDENFLALAALDNEKEHPFVI